MEWLVANWMNLVVAVDALLVLLIAVFVMVPGPQPEKAMKSILDLVIKLSRK